MKVILVNPYWCFQPPPIPVNLAEIAAYIRVNGYPDVSIVDLNLELCNETNPDVLLNKSIDRIESEKPDVVGITCTTVHVPFCVKFSKAFKSRNRSIPLVLGGPHVTFRSTQMFNLCDIDYIIRGEGEIAFTHLLDALKGEAKIENVPNLSYMSDGVIQHNPDAELIANLSSLPLPAYDLLNFKRCQSVADHSIWVTASRGCPFNCVFCSEKGMWKRYRYKEPEKVIGEIRHLIDRYDIDYIRFGDSSFTTHRKWVNSFLERLCSVGISWGCLARVDQVDVELLKRMKKAGCDSIYHGIESGSSRIRKIINKGINLENNQILNIVREEVELGINCKCSFIAGVPGETREEMLETIRLASEIRDIGAEVRYWIMTPYPGSPAMEKFKDKIITVNRWQKIRQGDSFGFLQFWMHYDIYDTLKSENPDFFMFEPDMEIDDFFELYQQGKRKLLPERPELYNLMFDYLSFEPDKIVFRDFSHEIQLESIADAQPGANLFIALDVCHDDFETLSERLGKLKPNFCLLSLQFPEIEQGSLVFEKVHTLLAALEKKNIDFRLTKPLPQQLLDMDQQGFFDKFQIPKSCRDCLELFKVDNGIIELCTGKKIFKIEYAYSRAQIYSLFEAFGDKVTCPSRTSDELK